MSFNIPSHDPESGAIAPSSWGDELNANFTALNTAFHVRLFPHGSGDAPLSGIAAAALSVVQSSDSGTYKPQWPILSFDAAQDEGRLWTIQVPRLLGGTLQLAGKYYMGSSTSGAVILAAQVAALSDGDTSAPAKAFDVVNFVSSTVPTTAGTVKAFSIALTDRDSVVSADWLSILFYRDGDGTNGTDDATGDLNLLTLDLYYTLE